MEAAICTVCLEASRGRLWDSTVTQIEALPGGGWRRVRFARKHTRCPLRLGFEG
jgi:hypothetical protein